MDNKLNGLMSFQYNKLLRDYNEIKDNFRKLSRGYGYNRDRHKDNAKQISNSANDLIKEFIYLNEEIKSLNNDYSNLLTDILLKHKKDDKKISFGDTTVAMYGGALNTFSSIVSDIKGNIQNIASKDKIIDSNISDLRRIMDRIKYDYNLESVSKYDKHLLELHKGLSNISSRSFDQIKDDRDYMKKCQQARSLNYRNSYRYSDNPELFDRVDYEIKKCKDIQTKIEEKNKEQRLKKIETDKKNAKRIEEDRKLREDYNKLKEQVRKGKEPPIQDKMKKGIVDKPITQDIDRRSPPRLTDKVRQIEADNLEVKDSKPRGEILDRPKMQPPNMVQLLKEKKPVPYQNKEGQFKLIQPTDKNIQKIEKIIQEDGKLDPLKMKDIVDFDVKDLKEMDIILNGYNDVNKYYYELLEEFYNYKKQTKMNEKYGISLLIQKENEIDSLKNIILKLKLNLEEFRSSCENKYIELKEKQDLLNKDKEKEFREVFDYLKELFKDEIKIQLSTTKDNIKLLKKEKELELLRCNENKKKKNSKKKVKKNTKGRKGITRKKPVVRRKREIPKRGKGLTRKRVTPIKRKKLKPRLSLKEKNRKITRKRRSIQKKPSNK